MIVINMETVLADTIATYQKEEEKENREYMMTITDTVTMKILPNMEGTAKTLNIINIKSAKYFKFLSKDKGIAMAQ